MRLEDCPVAGVVLIVVDADAALLYERANEIEPRILIPAAGFVEIGVREKRRDTA